MIRNIHWLANQPTHYHNYFFNQLVNNIKQEVTIHYINRFRKSHPWKTDFEHEFKYRIKPINSIFDFHFLKIIMTGKDSLFVIAANWSKINSLLIYIFLILLKRKYIIWTDTLKEKKRNKIKRGFRNIYIKIILNHAFKVFGTGKIAVDRLNNLVNDKRNIINFPFWVNLDLFTSQNKPDIYKEIIFLSSGRLVNWHKGFDLAIRAMGLLKDEFPNLNFKYLIAGVGKDEKFYNQLIHDLGLLGHIHLLGWLEADKLPEFYNRGQIFLHPAPFDPFPNSVLEAMACGLTVIASDGTGSALDRIVNTQNGFIHPKENLRSLYDIIKFLIMRRELIHKIGKNARYTAEQWKVDKGISIISNILNQQPT